MKSPNQRLLATALARVSDVAEEQTGGAARFRPRLSDDGQQERMIHSHFDRLKRLVYAQSAERYGSRRGRFYSFFVKVQKRFVEDI